MFDQAETKMIVILNLPENKVKIHSNDLRNLVNFFLNLVYEK